MSNKNLFSAQKKTSFEVRATDTVNAAGGKAYKMDKRRALAQIACTNCFNGTFYTSDQDSLKMAKTVALELSDDPEFIAKVALYSRSKSYMKDMPAFLTLVLANIDKPLFRKVFRKVIDNGKMLRNIVQMARSGAVNNKKFNLSAGTFRHAIQEWFDKKDSKSLFKASIGNDPSMRDILRMARPRPNSTEKEALFGYFLNKKVEFSCLPEIVQQYEKWKATKEGPVPDVDFRMLDSLGLTDKHWTEIAKKAPWMMTRMNINTFARHGVFKDKAVTKIIADRIRNEEEIKRARAFPYQLYTAWREVNGNNDVPREITESVQDAMEIAISNVPAINGTVHVCCDTSGSMSSPITGQSSGRHSSSVSCVEVAGLITSSILRNNKTATIWTFSSDAVIVPLNPRDTVTTNTAKIARAGGGTNVSAPLRKMNALGTKADVIVYVSDFESWIDNGNGGFGTGMSQEWSKFKERNPKARLVCCDLTPRTNSQINKHKDVLQIGGWSDNAFEVLSSFVENGFESDHWISEIDKISID